MSIVTEIQRLQQAKSDLKTSIQSKGVTVSSEAKLDDYPELVDSIQTGGGGDVSAYKDWIEGNTNTIPNGPTVLRSYCFCGEQDNEINIPSSVTHLYSHCFYHFSYSYGNTNQSLIIPDTVKTVGSKVFEEIGQYNRGISVTIKGVTTLSQRMFYNCNLRGFPTINPSITEFPSNCFEGTKFIAGNSNTPQVVQIPSQIKTINGNCFMNCTAQRIIIPDTVETISMNYTFFSNYLTQLQFLSPIPPTPSSGNSNFIFYQCKIYVPDEAVDTYKSTEGFSYWQNKIYPASEMPA